MEFQQSAEALISFQIFIFLGFALFGAVGFVFWVWMLVDCLKYESPEGNDKLIWVLVIVLANWIGALIYFFVRRCERRSRRVRTHFR